METRGEREQGGERVRERRQRREAAGEGCEEREEGWREETNSQFAVRGERRDEREAGQRGVSRQSAVQRVKLNSCRCWDRS